MDLASAPRQGAAAVLLLACLAGSVAGHGLMIIPASRQYQSYKFDSWATKDYKANEGTGGGAQGWSVLWVLGNRGHAGWKALSHHRHHHTQPPPPPPHPATTTTPTPPHPPPPPPPPLLPPAPQASKRSATSAL